MLAEAITKILLSGGGGGGGNAHPVFGKAGQLAAIVGVVLLLFILSYFFSRMGYDYAED